MDKKNSDGNNSSNDEKSAHDTRNAKRALRNSSLDLVFINQLGMGTEKQVKKKFKQDLFVDENSHNSIASKKDSYDSKSPTEKLIDVLQSSWHLTKEHGIISGIVNDEKLLNEVLFPFFSGDDIELANGARYRPPDDLVNAPKQILITREKSIASADFGDSSVSRELAFRNPDSVIGSMNTDLISWIVRK